MIVKTKIELFSILAELCNDMHQIDYKIEDETKSDIIGKYLNQKEKLIEETTKKIMKLFSNKKLKAQHYVEYFYPGMLVVETSSEMVDKRDPDKIKIPKGSFGFLFYDKKFMEEGGVLLQSNRFNVSNHYYIGKIYTIEDVKKAIPDKPSYSILLSNMESNDWDKVLKTPYGNFVPFEDGDVLLREVE